MEKKILVFILFLGFYSLSAQYFITGTIEDESGDRVPGVTVLLKGSDGRYGTISDANGDYQLSVPDEEGVLVFSFIGMETIERRYRGETRMEITMRYSSFGLDEIVAVGYGTQRRASVVGAISTVGSRELSQSPSANLGNALAGRLPGLTTIQISGEPGADDPNMYIRGRGTWEDSSPLFIIDGIERESITNIDPNEIESISILKDASATAVYGVRGANGVIIVTTKRGQQKRPTISFSSTIGFQTPTRIPNHLRSYETAMLKNEAILNDYAPDVFNRDGSFRMTTTQITTLLRQNGGFSPLDLEFFMAGTEPYHYPDVDWWGELVRTISPQQRYNFNISGGSRSARYFVSVGYLKQEGIFKTEGDTNFNFNRFNLRSNLDFDVTRDLTLSINLAARIEDRTLPNGSTWNPSGAPFYAMNRAAPYETPIINPDGRPGYGENKLNAWAGLNKTGKRRNQDDVLETAFIFNYSFDRYIKGLSAKGQFSYDSYYHASRSYGEEVMWSRIISPFGQPYNYEYEGADLPYSYLGGYANERERTYMEASLFYDRSFGSHNMTALMLYNQSDEKRSDQFIPHRYSGLVSRLTYDFSGRYFAEFNMGYNGSENFAPGRRFGFFPSYAVGWMVSEESFMDHLPVISLLKLRGSYGEVGNDKIGADARFLYIQDFSSTTAWAPHAGAKFGPDAENRMFIYEEAASNPLVTWERAAKTNIGIELFLYNDLIGITGDLFYEKRTDILLNRQTIMSYYGVQPPPANVGETENKGFELELTHRYRFSPDFDYWVKGNFNYAKNTILNMDEPPFMPEWQKREGHSIGQFQGYIVEGFFRDWDEIENSPEQVGVPVRPGDLKFKDLNDDGVIDQFDQTYIGYSNVPRINYGFSFGFNYKGFDYSMLFQGTAQTSMYLGDGIWYEFTNRDGKLLEHHRDRWAYYTDPFTREVVDTRDTAKYPRLNNGANPNRKLNSLFLLDNSYLKLRNIELGYTFRPEVLTRYNISSVRLYATGSNLYTWSDVKHVDPEGFRPERGSEENYPQMAVYSLGINVVF